MQRTVNYSEYEPLSVTLSRPNVEATVKVYYEPPSAIFSKGPYMSFSTSPGLWAFTNQEVLQIAEELKQAALLAINLEKDPEGAYASRDDALSLIDTLSDKDLAFENGYDGDY
jgi:hypothetical protein